MGWLSDADLQAIGFKSIGRGCKIDERAVIIGPQNIAIGDNVRIDCGAKLLAGGGAIRIESHIHIATDAVLMAAGGIYIGNFCCVGIGSKLISASDDLNGSFLVGPQIPKEFTNVKAEAIIMQQHSIVTTNCVVLPGVTMGVGSVIGANSLIRLATEPWQIYGGSPAKRIGARDLERCVQVLAKKFVAQWESTH